ncbi:hypothetical protein FGG08_003273 [Glutinoglossum americanum]|uniref:60S ribosomal protein L20 n=1 Tax=Glutinoglossum americanum TaxID=1670608 RepID=A0A9P8IDM1_9PEZI|nr:hypothetical protein FGG08_003273 [Glutinoglossum americanum]
MNSVVGRRLIVSLHPAQHPPLPLSLAKTYRRNESSFRRTKQRLRVKPADSFIHSPKSARQDHIIFNPPSSSPSVYHTPSKFIPAGDKRQDFLSAIQRDTPTSQLPPAIREPYQKQYHLTIDDIDEIRRLRTADPDVWTRAKLAKKFKCSSLFIGIVSEASPERKEEQVKVLEDIKSRWGRKRRTAREDRARRRDSWGRDE